MRSKNTLAAPLAALACVFAALPARAEPEARHVIHFELAGLGLNGSASISYEHLVGDHGGVRVGLGYAALNGFDGDGRGVGAFAMWDFLFGRGASRFELGLGLSVLFQSDAYDWCWVGGLDGTCVDPQLSIAYRHQPRAGGFLFRAGLMWTLSYGMPLGIGAGWAF